MINRDRCINELREHKTLFSQKFNVHSMKLFGSVARNEQTEKSDVDLLVEMEPNMFMQVGLKQYLEQLLGCGVDVLRLHTNMDRFLLNQIDRDGIVIFS